MLNCFAAPDADANLITVVPIREFEAWLADQPGVIQAWLEAKRFKAKPGAASLLPPPAGGDGRLSAVVCIGSPASLWDFAGLPQTLGAGDWQLVGQEGSGEQVALGWALAAYTFDRYRKAPTSAARLTLAEDQAVLRAQTVARAVYLARDLVNTPSNDLGPAELESAVQAVAERHGASVHSVVGEALLEQNYPAIHAVGRASPRPPRLIELRWGRDDMPLVTLVGKGVCFDTGGLDIKPAAAMLNMKKDMGGAAAMLGLADAVMGLRLPVRLRLLIPAVENSIAGNSFRPGDVLRTRKGLSVEIGNTDAEGRLVLADALAEADRERPDVLIDAATLTGAARVALGPELPALFSPSDELAAALLRGGEAAADPLWRLPLHRPYREMLDSEVADINNAGAGGFAGSITAALFLQSFVTETTNWAHLDVFAWNPKRRPGRPKGGEASALRALLTALEARYAA